MEATLTRRFDDMLSYIQMVAWGQIGGKASLESTMAQIHDAIQRQQAAKSQSKYSGTILL